MKDKAKRGGKRAGAGRKKITDESQRKIKKPVTYFGYRYTEEEKQEMKKEIEEIKEKNNYTTAKALYMRVTKKK